MVAEPCLPIIVAHGHVADLIEKDVDYIFVPNLLNTETPDMRVESHVCPWGQTLPFVLRQVPQFRSWFAAGADDNGRVTEMGAERFGRLLSPRLEFRRGYEAVRQALRAMTGPLGVPRRICDRALQAGLAAQNRFRQLLLEAGQRALAKLAETDQPAIVLVGRPYNVFDPGVSLAVAHKLRQYYGVNVIPMDCLPTEQVCVRDVNANMYWNYGRKILAAAKIVGQHPNLHIIYLTNFKCGPDSFIKHFVRRASGKPFLTLQFDAHSNDAGVMTRCEAYLDSKGILRWQPKDRQSRQAAGQTVPV